MSTDRPGPHPPPEASHCRAWAQDVNAAVAGFAEAGADEIVVNDAHCGMDNVL
ncbi:M55 family metallopeptidase, partial [Streptomyces sp. NPDC001478]